MSNKKKVGILTMHKVQNFGSALQAFGLQYVVDKLGFDAYIVDYKFPNIAHGASDPGIIQRIKTTVGKLFDLTPGCVALNKFDLFYKNYFKLSRSYSSKEQIYSNPPIYDIYMTGSDQVWNPKFIKEDMTFYLDFIEGVKKIAYAPSFGVSEISERCEEIEKSLRAYDHLSVREKSGAELIERMISKGVPIVLDPTLLVSAEEWNKLMNVENYGKEKYVFLYLQKYSFDPSCMMETLLRKIQRELGWKVYTTCKLPASCDGLYVCFEDAGPIDFLRLVRNASYIITASFHGTAFAVNYNIPFNSIILSKNVSDDRQLAFLRLMNIEDRCLLMDNIDSFEFDFSALDIENRLNSLREFSIEYLNQSLHS